MEDVLERLYLREVLLATTIMLFKTHITHVIFITQTTFSLKIGD